MHVLYTLSIITIIFVLIYLWKILFAYTLYFILCSDKILNNTSIIRHKNKSFNIQKILTLYRINVSNFIKIRETMEQRYYKGNIHVFVTSPWKNNCFTEKKIMYLYTSYSRWEISSIVNYRQFIDWRMNVWKNRENFFVSN